MHAEFAVVQRIGVLSDPESLARRVAESLRLMSNDPALRNLLGEGARAKVQREGLWSAKAAGLVELYSDIAANRTVSPVIRMDSISSPISPTDAPFST